MISAQITVTHYMFSIKALKNPHFQVLSYLFGIWVTAKNDRSGTDVRKFLILGKEFLKWRNTPKVKCIGRINIHKSLIKKKHFKIRLYKLKLENIKQ